MTSYLLSLIYRFFNPVASDLTREVEYSCRKYRETYKLLEEYDKKALRDPKTLADPGRLRTRIQELQRTAGA